MVPRGIGLFRTEFLYLGRTDLPSEDEHYLYAKGVLEHLGGRLATFRTFDLGGDKMGPPGTTFVEQNPALGLRSVRICLTPSGRPLFQAQLRGLLRASVHGPLRIMFPLIAASQSCATPRRSSTSARKSCARAASRSIPAIKIGESCSRCPRRR